MMFRSYGRLLSIDRNDATVSITAEGLFQLRKAEHEPAAADLRNM